MLIVCSRKTQAILQSRHEHRRIPTPSPPWAAVGERIIGCEGGKWVCFVREKMGIIVCYGKKWRSDGKKCWMRGKERFTRVIEGKKYGNEVDWWGKKGGNKCVIDLKSIILYFSLYLFIYVINIFFDPDYYYYYYYFFFFLRILFIWGKLIIYYYYYYFYYFFII